MRVRGQGVKQWRGFDPEEAAEDGRLGGEAQGDAGAEWKTCLFESARSECFSEEELWWRFGCVTGDGVVIKGTGQQIHSACSLARSRQRTGHTIRRSLLTPRPAPCAGQTR